MKNSILSLLVFSFTVEASNYTPAQMSSLAEDRAPLIRMQLEGQSAAASQVNQSKLIANPVFALQAGALRPQGDRAGSVTDLTINQPIPWPGKREAAINSAKILEKITDVDVNEARLLVHHSVSLLSLEQAALSELEKHHAERKARFSLIHRFLGTRPQASPQQKIEKELIETQIRLVEGQMYEIETRRMALTSQLEALTGERDPKVLVEWRPAPQIAELAFFQSQLGQNPTLKRAERLNDLAKNKIEEAKYLAKPDLVVGVNYRQENVAPVNHFYHANFAVVIPIIDRGQHSVETARALARREEAGKKLVEIDAFNRLQLSYRTLVAAKRSTELFKITDLEKVERRFRESEDAFRKGRIDVTTFLQSDTQIHESIDLAYYSYLKYFTALSEVKILTGQRLEMP